MVTADLILKTLAPYLEPELAAEIGRLYDIEAAHQVLVVEHRRLEREHHRSTVVVGELRGQLATALDRIKELCPEEIIKARRDAHMLGAGFFRVISRGRNRYATERLEPDTVTIRPGSAR